LTSVIDQPLDLTDYDAKHTLASVVAARSGADRLEAELLAFIVHFCDLHPVVDEDDEPATTDSFGPEMG